MSKNPVVDVAKEMGKCDNDIHTLGSGIKVKLLPVPPALINDVMLRVEIPKPPLVEAKDGRLIPNPLDPTYAAEMAQYEQRRGQNALDAVAMFGIELVDGLPKDESWIHKLQILGVNVDASDKVECEFYYKKYIALGNDLEQLQTLMGITDEDVEQAKKV